MYREAMAGHAIAAVVIELRRHEVQLYIRASTGHVAANEPAGFGGIGRADAVSCHEIFQADQSFPQQAHVVADRFANPGDSADIEMILQVFADAWQVMNHRYSEALQVFARTDS